MSLSVGTITAVNPVTETTILTYTASAGEFLRGWNVWGKREAECRLYIGANLKHIGHIGNIVDVDDAKTFVQNFTPIALAASDSVTIKIVKNNNGGANDDFRGEIY